MAPTPAIDPAAVRRIMMIRPRFLGDICLTLPALDAIRAACPGAQVAYVAESAAAELLEGDPRVDALIVIPRAPKVAETLDLVAQMRAFRPDLTFDFFCNPRTAVWTFLSGAGVRVGYPNKGWRSALYTHHARPRTLSATGFHLASLAALGWPFEETVPRLHVTHGAREAAIRALREDGVPEASRFVGFHPGARWPTRRWPPGRFIELARRALDSDPNVVALVSGGPDEAARVREVLRGLPADRAFPVIGWRIGRFVALQSMCDAFVCGDTGPLHTGVAAGTPTLGLMSRNRPAMFFPYPESAGHRAYYARVECSPCHRDLCDDLRCLDRLTVDGAWRILETMLARGPRGAAIAGAPGALA